MGAWFNQKRQRRYTRFDKAAEEENRKRVQFRRLQAYERTVGRNPLWLGVMLAAVLFLIYYLSKF
ncbi:MAG: hypothetical protein AUJ47_09845 [Candidatus Marinimicrobia bacterium CG1_02_48_14]|nr:MAG: hypothetical protein AUJ47_09845 [Candidatus Marinimicrobia bacterium CG1_02_48_14]PIZ65655.1 MAG: hypothetical protein COY19_07670 [Candidatus Marinimicrobia bacterium CG_4_10_14_0_2_um_filter_48_9]PJA53724.1 MAG: hypothetical protein CO167_06985 [Candidatus Marinimicrobia bacterium CG_4_9_14_3_um_filter_48_9]